MSKHPTERIRSVAEMQATSMQQSDKALRRMAAAEERLARLEGRLAEKDQMISDFQEAYGRQAETISALTAVVRELEAKMGKGVDQVFSGLEKRVNDWEPRFENIWNGLRDQADTLRDVQGVVSNMNRRYQKFFDVLMDDMPTLSQLQRKQGRPKGSKNKPKDTPAVEQPSAEMGQNTPIQQPEGE